MKMRKGIGMLVGALMFAVTISGGYQVAIADIAATVTPATEWSIPGLTTEHLGDVRVYSWGWVVLGGGPVWTFDTSGATALRVQGYAESMNVRVWVNGRETGTEVLSLLTSAPWTFDLDLTSYLPADTISIMYNGWGWGSAGFAWSYKLTKPMQPCEAPSTIAGATVTPYNEWSIPGLTTVHTGDTRTHITHPAQVPSGWTILGGGPVYTIDTSGATALRVYGYAESMKIIVNGSPVLTTSAPWTFDLDLSGYLPADTISISYNGWGWGSRLDPSWTYEMCKGPVELACEVPSTITGATVTRYNEYILPGLTTVHTGDVRLYDWGWMVYGGGPIWTIDTRGATGLRVYGYAENMRIRVNGTTILTTSSSHPVPWTFDLDLSGYLPADTVSISYNGWGSGSSGFAWTYEMCTCTFDADGDGHSTPDSCSGTKDDCDDNDATVYPGAPELCDGKDNNCDGVREAFSDAELLAVCEDGRDIVAIACGVDVNALSTVRTTGSQGQGKGSKMSCIAHEATAYVDSLVVQNLICSEDADEMHSCIVSYFASGGKSQHFGE